MGEEGGGGRSGGEGGGGEGMRVGGGGGDGGGGAGREGGGAGGAGPGEGSMSGGGGGGYMSAVDKGDNMFHICDVLTLGLHNDATKVCLMSHMGPVSLMSHLCFKFRMH